MNLPEVGGEPQRIQIGLADGKTATFDGLLRNMSFDMAHDDVGEVKLTIIPTGPIETAKQNLRVIPPRPGDEWDTTNCPWTVPGHDDDIAVFPGPIVQLTGWLQPFAYGLAFLLLLWACMAWEKWIGWVM